jgi:hypothetical protein
MSKHKCIGVTFLFDDGMVECEDGDNANECRLAVQYHLPGIDRRLVLLAKEKLRQQLSREVEKVVAQARAANGLPPIGEESHS